jgi:hypothetical protein
MASTIAPALRLVGGGVLAITSLHAPDARADDYDFVPRLSTLELVGHGTVDGVGVVDYVVPVFGSGTGRYEMSGHVDFVSSAADAAIAVGGHLQATRVGGNWIVTSASIRPFAASGPGTGMNAWAGALAGDVGLHNLTLPDSSFGLLAPLLTGFIPTTTSFASGGVAVGLNGTTPVQADGTFDTAGLHASIDGLVEAGSVEASWAVPGQATAAGAGWVGGRNDGTLFVPFSVQWHQDLALTPYAFDDAIATPLGAPATFDVHGGGTFAIDWTLSGSLLAVATSAVPEPGAAWLVLWGLGGIFGLSRARGRRPNL